MKALFRGITFALSMFLLAGQYPAANAQSGLTLKVTRADRSTLQLNDSYELRQGDSKRSPSRQALSLAGGDVDGDGFPDLVDG